MSKPIIVPSQSDNRNMERYLHTRLAKVGSVQGQEVLEIDTSSGTFTEDEIEALSSGSGVVVYDGAYYHKTFEDDNAMYFVIVTDTKTDASLAENYLQINKNTGEFSLGTTTDARPRVVANSNNPGSNLEPLRNLVVGGVGYAVPDGTQESIIAWDGTSTPVAANIPAGVVVTYNGTDYTGSMQASASTMGKIYMVADGNNEYDRYFTSTNGSTYSWVDMGSTAIDLTDCATKQELGQLEAKKIDKTLPSDTFYITDSNGNIIAQIDADGVSSVDVKVKVDGEPVSVKSLLSTLSGDISTVAGSVVTEKNRAETEEAKKLDHTLADNKFIITDSDGNIIFKVDATGAHSAQDKHAVACMVLGEYYYPTATPTRDGNGNITHAAIMYGTGVEGTVDITYSGGNATQVIAGYGNYSYTISIQRDASGNVELVTVN